MNNMKRILAVLLTLVFLFAAIGCGEKMSVPEEIKKAKGGAELYVKRELTNEIADSINSNDPERIRALLSDYALERSNYEEEIKKLFELVPDGFTPEKASCYSSLFEDKPSWKDGTGYENMYLGGQFSFTGENGMEYTLYFYWIKLCSSEPEKQGIHHITVVSKDAKDKKKYEIAGKDDEPGINFYE